MREFSYKAHIRCGFLSMKCQASAFWSDAGPAASLPSSALWPRQAGHPWSAPAVPLLVAEEPGLLPGRTLRVRRRAGGSVSESAWEEGSRSSLLGPEAHLTSVSLRPTACAYQVLGRGFFGLTDLPRRPQSLLFRGSQILSISASCMHSAFVSRHLS